MSRADSSCLFHRDRRGRTVSRATVFRPRRETRDVHAEHHRAFAARLEIDDQELAASTRDFV